MAPTNAEASRLLVACPTVAVPCLHRRAGASRPEGPCGLPSNPSSSSGIFRCTRSARTDLCRERGASVSGLRPSVRVLHTLRAAKLDTLAVVRGGQSDPLPRLPVYVPRYDAGPKGPGRDARTTRPRCLEAGPPPRTLGPRRAPSSTWTGQATSPRTSFAAIPARPTPPGRRGPRVSGAAATGGVSGRELVAAPTFGCAA
jgi:hypothetical protein